MDKQERFDTRKARAWVRKQRRAGSQHKQKSNRISIDVDALQQIIRDVYALGRKDGRNEQHNSMGRR